MSGAPIYGTPESYEYMARRRARVQGTVTAVSANRQLSDGIGGQIQEPALRKEEDAYLKATVQTSYEQTEQARTRL